jgi:hypothetical protein
VGGYHPRQAGTPCGAVLWHGAGMGFFVEGGQPLGPVCAPLLPVEPLTLLPRWMLLVNTWCLIPFQCALVMHEVSAGNKRCRCRRRPASGNQAIMSSVALVLHPRSIACCMCWPDQTMVCCRSGVAVCVLQCKPEPMRVAGQRMGARVTGVTDRWYKNSGNAFHGATSLAADDSGHSWVTPGPAVTYHTAGM